MATLERVADVVYDPWIEHTPLQLMNDEALAARIAEEGADIVVCEADTCKGAVLDAGLRGHRLDPGRSHQRRRGRRHRAGHPGAARPRPQRRRRGRAGRRPAPGRHPGHRPRRPGRPRPAPSTTAGPSPTSATGPGRSPARPSGIVGLGSVGRAAAWRFEGLGHEGHRPRPVQRRRHPRRSTTCWPRPTSSRCTPWSPRTRIGPARRRPVRPHEARRGLPQHRPGRPPRHRRPDRGARPRATSAAPASTTSRARTCRPTTRCRP